MTRGTSWKRGRVSSHPTESEKKRSESREKPGFLEDQLDGLACLQLKKLALGLAQQIELVKARRQVRSRGLGLLIELQ